ncbi:MAG: hypothetical protein ACOYM3_30135, partial [Terrimicrobiaceae bacterium]
MNSDSLDVTKLENVRTGEGKTIARCPACAESGGDNKGDHLFIAPDGRFGCVKYPGPDGVEHRSRIFAQVGKREADHGESQPPVDTRPKQHWATAEQAASTCKPHYGSFESVFSYPLNGQSYAAVARYKIPGDKTFRQFRFIEGAWELGGPEGKWPLFGVAAIPETGIPTVHEGEKCQIAATAIGLPSVCSAGGSNAAAKTDWTPLAGRDVAIFPDHDKAGEAYAQDVARILTGLIPPARVRIVRLPVAEPKADIVDFLREGGTVADIQ